MVARFSDAAAVDAADNQTFVSVGSDLLPKEPIAAVNIPRIRLAFPQETDGEFRLWNEEEDVSRGAALCPR